MAHTDGTIPAAPPTRARSPASAESSVRLCVVLTSFNRREKTLECLNALASSEGIDSLQLSAVLVDDASTDGTGEAVTEAFPWVTVARGSGSLFWCRGMHMAFDIALRGGYEYYLWLNDDTTLLPDALARLLATEAELRLRGEEPTIVVGSTVDAATGALTYGGHIRPSRLMPTTFRQLVPGREPRRCDTMTGNIVLIPHGAARIVGNLDPVFEHAMGDTDYALRAKRSGVGVWLGSGIYGYCSGNAVTATYRDVSLGLTQRWRLVFGRKGLPWKSWLVLTRRHAGFLWPLYFAWPYARLLVSALFRPSPHRP